MAVFCRSAGATKTPKNGRRILRGCGGNATVFCGPSQKLTPGGSGGGESGFGTGIPGFQANPSCRGSVAPQAIATLCQLGCWPQSRLILDSVQFEWLWALLAASSFWIWAGWRGPVSSFRFAEHCDNELGGSRQPGFCQKPMQGDAGTWPKSRLIAGCRGSMRPQAIASSAK